jgi:hypothetical protein
MKKLFLGLVLSFVSLSTVNAGGDANNPRQSRTDIVFHNNSDKDIVVHIKEGYDITLVAGEYIEVFMKGEASDIRNKLKDGNCDITTKKRGGILNVYIKDCSL